MEGIAQSRDKFAQASFLALFGLVGYDQWQVSDNGGLVLPRVSASRVPHYSVHSIGLQSNSILPAKGPAFFSSIGRGCHLSFLTVSLGAV